jgi:hypothetical protein
LKWQFSRHDVFEQLATVNTSIEQMSEADPPHFVKRRLSAGPSGAVAAPPAVRPRRVKREADSVPPVAVRGAEEAPSIARPRREKREAVPVPAGVERAGIKLVGKVDSLSQGDFITRHRAWCAKWAGNTGFCPRREHNVLSLALDAAVKTDGLDIRNLKFADVLLRRKQEIEEAVAELDEDFCRETGAPVRDREVRSGVVLG